MLSGRLDSSGSTSSVIVRKHVEDFQSGLVIELRLGGFKFSLP